MKIKEINNVLEEKEKKKNAMEEQNQKQLIIGKMNSEKVKIMEKEK